MSKLIELLQSHNKVSGAFHWRKEPDWKMDSYIQADRHALETSTANLSHESGMLECRVHAAHLPEFHKWLGGLITNEETP